VLIDHDAVVNAQDAEGVTPLYIASRKNFVPLVRLFLSLSQPAQPPPPAEDPLAGFGGSMDWGGALEDNTNTNTQQHQQQLRRVDVNATTKEGDTPLFIASYYGYVEVVQLLLDHGADVNIKFNGVTPLSMAKKNDHRDIVNLLERNSWRKANSRHPVPLSRPALRPSPFPMPPQFGNSGGGDGNTNNNSNNNNDDDNSGEFTWTG